MDEVTESGIAEEIIGNEPRVREEVVAELQAKETANLPPDQSNTDTATSSGTANEFKFSESSAPETFNPSIHETDENGRPVFNAKGGYRKKRGRKPGFSPSSSSSKNTGKAGQNESVSASNGTGTDSMPDYSATGKILAGLFFGVTTSMIGPEWEPSVSENENITNATVRYCEAMEISDIPPGIALLLCVGMYAAPRFQHPNTRAKLRSAMESVGVVKKKNPLKDVKPEDMPSPVSSGPPPAARKPANVYSGLPIGS